MAKVFSFTSVLRKNMMEKDKPDLYYALAKSSGEIDIDEMAERIQRSSTVNWADVVCVLRALQTEMIDSFKKGDRRLQHQPELSVDPVFQVQRYGIYRLCKPRKD